MKLTTPGEHQHVHRLLLHPQLHPKKGFLASRWSCAASSLEGSLFFNTETQRNAPFPSFSLVPLLWVQKTARSILSLPAGHSVTDTKTGCLSPGSRMGSLDSFPGNTFWWFLFCFSFEKVFHVVCTGLELTIFLPRFPKWHGGFVLSYSV